MYVARVLVLFLEGLFGCGCEKEEEDDDDDDDGMFFSFFIPCVCGVEHTHIIRYYKYCRRE